MARLRTAILVVAAAATVAPQVAGQVRDGPVAGQLDRFIRDSIPAFSGQLLVAREGRVLLHQGYGLADREAGRPVTVETVFDIGSITKQFTAAAVMALAGEGRLDVGDTLGRWVDGLHGRIAGVTLHQLLTHTAGVAQYSGDDYEPMTARDFAVWLDTARLVGVPGEEFHYSNPGYSALALVVERATGMPYERFVQTRLFAPAGLRRTGYTHPDWSTAPLAVGYDREGARFGTPLDHFWHGDGPSWNLRANGGMLSTAGEMYRWVEALRTGRVLAPASFRRMTAGHVETGRPGGRRYGYGWQVGVGDDGRVFTEHTGGNGAFLALVRWYEDPDLVIVAVMNAFEVAALQRVVRAVRAAVDAP